VLLSPIADTVLGHPYVDYGGDMRQWFDFAEEIGGYDKALRRYASDRAELALRLEHDLVYCVPNPPEDSFSQEPVPSGDFDLGDPVDAVKYGILLQERALEKGPQDIRVYGYIREELSRRGLDLPIYAPAFFHGIWTNVNLMQTMLLDPETAHAHFSLCTKQALGRINSYITDGIELIGVGGDFAGNQPLISPVMYHEFIMPELRVLTDTIRTAGGFSVNASDGMLWDVLDDFLLASGVDGYGEIDAHAGMDLGKLKSRYGQTITLLGNIDSGNLLSFADENEIKAASIRCIEDGLGNGGHIFTVSNAVTESVPLKNYAAMVSAYRDYFNLPRLKLEF
jgi:hypothetical protein